MIIVALMAAPAGAGAKANRRNIWISLGLAPIALLHETTLHEAAHVAYAKAAIPGLEVTRFSPWPCRDSVGQLHFGCFGSRRPEDAHVGNGTEVGISVAPYALGVAAFAVSDILLSTRAVDPKGPGGAILYTLGMLAPFIDFAANLIVNRGFLGRGDWQNIGERSGGHVFDVVGGVLLAAGAYRLAIQGRAVLAGR